MKKRRLTKYEMENILSSNEKICTVCGILKPLDDYHKQSTAFDGKRPQCKRCTCLAVSEWASRVESKEKIKEWGKTYDWAAANKRHYYKDVDKSRAKDRAQSAKYRANNRVKLARLQREYIANNKEKVKEAKKLWVKNNPEKRG